MRSLRSLREEALLEKFTQQARNIAENADVHASFAEKKCRKKKRQFDERSSDEVSTDPAACFKKYVYYLSFDVIDHQMNERFGKNPDVMAAFYYLSPESLLNRSPFEKKISLDELQSRNRREEFLSGKCSKESVQAQSISLSLCTLQSCTKCTQISTSCTKSS